MLTLLKINIGNYAPKPPPTIQIDHTVHRLFKIKNCNGKKGNLVHGYDPCWKCILCSHLFLSCHLLSLRKINHLEL